MRAVRSLIQNQRHFTATHSSCPPSDSAFTANSTQLSPHTETHTQTSYFHRTHRLVVRFLTVCRETQSVAVTAAIRPPECALRWPQINLLLPGDALLQSQTDVGDWLSVCPMISTLRSEWRWYCPISAFKPWTGPSSSPNALLTDNLYIQWRSLTPFTGRCRSNRRGEEALDTATAQEDNRIPPRSLKCHRDDWS